MTTTVVKQKRSILIVSSTYIVSCYKFQMRKLNIYVYFKFIVHPRATVKDYCQTHYVSPRVVFVLSLHVTTAFVKEDFVCLQRINSNLRLNDNMLVRTASVS